MARGGRSGERGRSGHTESLTEKIFNKRIEAFALVHTSPSDKPLLLALQRAFLPCNEPKVRQPDCKTSVLTGPVV